MKKILGIILLILIAPSICSCAMKWKSSWPEHGGNDNLTVQSVALRGEALKVFNRANDAKSLRESIRAYENVLSVNPGDYLALKQLSTQYILLGTAYTRSRREKSLNFRQAMSYAEKAMYTNAGFRAVVDTGLKPWEAAEKLTSKEVEAMFFWVTALQYEFKEGMTLAGKVANIDWLQRAMVFLERIETVAPEYGGGAVEFAKVICYYVLPKSKSGSKKMGDASMSKAVNEAGGWLLPRWARGKYYYPILGEKIKSRQELQWVASRDLDQFADPYPWRVHFKEDALKLSR